MLLESVNIPLRNIIQLYRAGHALLDRHTMMSQVLCYGEIIIVWFEEGCFENADK